MPKLPKNVKVGTRVTKKIKRKGKRRFLRRKRYKRKITWEKTKPRGKNKNLTWKIVSNKKN